MSGSFFPGGQGLPFGGVIEGIGGLLRELPAMVSDRVELLSLELDRAGLALLHITCLGLALLVLALGGWFLFWGLVIAACMAAGLHWGLAMLVALLVHILIGWWVVSRIRHLLPALGLPATRRQLTFTSQANADDEPSPSVSTTATS